MNSSASSPFQPSPSPFHPRFPSNSSGVPVCLLGYGPWEWSLSYLEGIVLRLCIHISYIIHVSESKTFINSCQNQRVARKLANHVAPGGGNAGPTVIAGACQNLSRVSEMFDAPHNSTTGNNSMNLNFCLLMGTVQYGNPFAFGVQGNEGFDILRISEWWVILILVIILLFWWTHNKEGYFKRKMEAARDYISREHGSMSPTCHPNHAVFPIPPIITESSL